MKGAQMKGCKSGVARFDIAPDRSRVWIDARSSLHPIHSSTDGLEGYVELEVGPSGALSFGEAAEGRLSLRVARLSSGHRLEDREMLKRIDARRCPTIEGVLCGIRALGNAGRYEVSGEVTFRGVSRRCQDEMTIEPVDAATLRLAGSSRFDVRDFGMDPPRILMLRVDPEVDVRVEIIAVRPC
jgi:YceI-like domain